MSCAVVEMTEVAAVLVQESQVLRNPFAAVVSTDEMVPLCDTASSPGLVSRNLGCEKMAVPHDSERFLGSAKEEVAHPTLGQILSQEASSGDLEMTAVVWFPLPPVHGVELMVTMVPRCRVS
jgi:hypothetical protein